MKRQISVKALRSTGATLKQMYDEALTYLGNIGYNKEQIFALTEADRIIRTFMFVQGSEKILVEYQQDTVEEVLKIAFGQTEIKFVYDILLMRFNQIARDKNGNVFVFNN
ncbi:MAG: hypothetical protein ABIJ34_03410 [archaeon]